MSKIALSGNASGSGTFTLAAPNSNSDRTLTLPDVTGTIVTTGSSPSFPTTIGVGGATPSASGAGITFPATQSASSDANTLDDYEEGTWTPVLNSFTNTGGRTLTGRYTKIGRQVHIIISISGGTQTLTSTANSSNIIGLPFTVAASSFSCFAGISTNNLDTVNQGSQFYANSTILYTCAFTAASDRIVSISGTYEV
jgi:hypothetical protein